MTTDIPFTPLALDQSDVRYVHGPDSTRQDGVPSGTVTMLEWNTSSIYPGTSRRFWVYVPAQYDAGDPPSLLVLQDGEGFLDPEDDVRVTIVLDNLIHRGDLPATIAVFVDPGNRNAEYDAFDDRYVRFLTEEVLPEVRQRWTITDDHDRWAICGFSCGGNCAFTAAWLRPDIFRRVVCLSPTFPQMPGGNPYPELIAQTPAKPLRIFMQAPHRDLGWNEPAPEYNWLADNLRVAAALAEAAYDFRLVLGDGEHSSNHGGVLFPDALRWLFRAPEAQRT
ncbi:alpha/beta hydrolase [Nocardioides sp.]|uniref:alpha/beta hydrolase n=1 Tax=Nocardioides sp. TaxID=35761 RepID=UPI002C5077DF|nr:alpha/beta hydrolase-fold protein [Nocardioides sp.]HXH79713.1 alpha/beta hydrolase-fold protein [Nocardioides sp.]